MKSHSQNSSRDFAVAVVRRLRDAGFDALWAGGCVRDFVLGLVPADYDVATTATPEEVRELFGTEKTVPVGASFGVMLVLGAAGVEPIEVATFRREGEYIDGRRPESVEYCTPEEDAHRRDFTINGMFYDPLEDVVHDFVGGESDLKRKILRCIGDPEDRFAEDKLRMLRAVRFAARFEFEIEDSTVDAVRKHAQELSVVSAERISQELMKMLSHQHRRQAVDLMVKLDLWPIVLPEIPCSMNDENWLELLRDLDEPSPELVLAILGRDLSLENAERLTRRLKLSNEQRVTILWLIAHLHELQVPHDLPLHRLKRLLSNRSQRDLLEFTRAFEKVQSGTQSAFDFCEEYLTQTPVEVLEPEPLLTGDDLIRRGLQPGRAFKLLLESVRVAQLNETIESQEEAWQLIEQLQADLSSDWK